ncbi:MAG: amidohydrolase [Kiritimatiellae bacterium]|nr:amidohydrolase [Kiritimatiellia bacterium]
MLKQIREMIDTRRRLAAKLDFLDANIWLGRPEGFPLAKEMNAKQLNGVLKTYFTRSGLISHWQSKMSSAQDGNAALEKLAPALPHGLGVIWTGLPLLNGETGPLPGMGSMPRNLSGVRIFPKTHNFIPEDWVIGSLCEWLVAKNLPLFVWHTEIEWTALHRLAGGFPKLTIVVESQPRKILYHSRSLFPLMRACRNVRVDISNFAGQSFVEYVVREFGAERLIYGSFLPVSDPLVPIGMVLDADIADTEKKMIAGDNLRRLMAASNSAKIFHH